MGHSRPWQEQWRAVIRDFMALGRCYSGQHADPDMRQIVIAFCHSCHHLATCLELDPDVPVPVRHAVQAHVADSPHITLVTSVAREGADLRPVVERQPPRTTMRIEWDHSNGTPGCDDAFDVAGRAVNEWRAFLTRHGLNTGAVT